MIKVKLFVLIFITTFSFMITATDAQPVLRKVYDQGPTILIEKNEFVNYVKLYILVDKTHLNSKDLIHRYVIYLENKFSEQGGICRTYWNSNLPELPMNYRQQNFLVAWFPAEAFGQNLAEILKAIFHPLLKERLLYYDKNIVTQKENVSANHDSLENEPQPQTDESLDIVTLRQNLYLFFSGKISTFEILKTLGPLVQNPIEETGAKEKSDSKMRYWLVLFQKFIVEQIKQSGSWQNDGCQRIIATVDYDQNKILIDASFQKTVDRLFKKTEIDSLFKQWYLTDYLQSFRRLDFEDDQKAFLQLYSACYLSDQSLFELDLNMDEQKIGQILNQLGNFVDYYETR